MIKAILKMGIRYKRRIQNYFKYICIRDLKVRKVLRDASPKLELNIDRDSQLYLASPCFINESGCNFSVREKAILSIGAKTFFNRNCTIVAREKISIGNNCLFGPNVYICDHDHDFNHETISTTNYRKKSVEIGDGCWVGAGVIILKGCKIGKNCIIGAGSVISGNIPDNTVLIQKRNNIYKDR